MPLFANPDDSLVKAMQQLRNDDGMKLHDKITAVNIGVNAAVTASGTTKLKAILVSLLKQLKEPT